MCFQHEVLLLPMSSSICPYPSALYFHSLTILLTRLLCRICRVIRAAKFDMQLTCPREGLPSLRPCLGHLEAVSCLGVGFRRVLKLLIGVEEGEALQGLLGYW